ncbi:hypothetical protein TPADAL_0537a [Treponema pallidum subsp. pallidum DAL-1]|uniref:Uncharacterized protein n=2 Tax=Treponema pallidum TaxID=160 RepID=A0AAU8RMD2_TREPL|nr:hypothetical protein TPESAMD_0537a [Treponema pallidum subsp. pertenue str. SamoaD]AEZ58729.1 hypothetical protein TPECDC2_0537a [Treponema pallidum subsp. pertenue str. CDC2]AEZ59797.1 hypothetical protein TPEGAU_0537a [Treponema pallidum subsp. pertenue str. Gauthier]AEZ60860.1 hypothetical protein TPADAL_0537a [Treponema pallidum subsp. pallidum DAL-1]AGK84181.1 hypothetical protein TPFB_0537a [Treponema pallidum str. Fribourg-Blanc]AHN67209.1 hypothetical protein TPSea814_000537a [Trepo
MRFSLGLGRDLLARVCLCGGSIEQFLVELSAGCLWCERKDVLRRGYARLFYRGELEDA